MREPLTKGDVDRNLWAILHPARHRAIGEKLRIQDDFIKNAGGLQHSRLLITVVVAFDDVHRDALIEAMKVLQEFSRTIPNSRSEISGWARPHLEVFNDNLLGALPRGFPAEQHGTVVVQQRAVFLQRLDGALRDFEIGFIDGRNVLADLPKPEGSSKKDLFAAKPIFWGFSIDLMELWHRFRRR